MTDYLTQTALDRGTQAMEESPWDTHFLGKNCLVTGAQGFLGSNLSRRLVHAGAHVVGLVKDIRPASILDIYGIRDKMVVIQGDLKNMGLLERILAEYQVEHIFHLGAHSAVKVASRMPREAFETNVMGTVNILEAARQQGGRIKSIGVASSDKCYGDHERLPYTEDMALQAQHTYDATKACTDIAARTFAHNYGMPVVVTRSANIYGPGDMNFTRLFPSSITKLLQGRQPVLYEGVADFEREFVFTEDVASAYFALMANIDRTRGQAYNIGTGQTHRVGDVMDMLRRKINPDIAIDLRKKDTDFKEIQRQWINPAKLQALTGWKAKVELDEGLERTIDFYRTILNGNGHGRAYGL